MTHPSLLVFTAEQLFPEVLGNAANLANLGAANAANVAQERPRSIEGGVYMPAYIGSRWTPHHCVRRGQDGSFEEINELSSESPSSTALRIQRALLTPRKA